MSRIAEYFAKSFPDVLSLRKTMVVREADGAPEEKVVARVHVAFDAHVRFISVLITQIDRPEAIAEGILRNLPLVLAYQGVDSIDLPKLGPGSAGFQLQIENRPEGAFVRGSHTDGSGADASALPFSGRVFFYTEYDLPSDAKDRLKALTQGTPLSPVFRGPAFAAAVDKAMHPRAFISHDWRDKSGVALPIALGLQQLMCPVWYDDFSMRVGQSLRESIEKGIKECGFCILVLTPNFLKNGGWPKREYTMAFTKELVEEQEVILPVWHDVSQKDVYEYSPLLADKLGVPWSLGPEEVCRRLYRAIDRTPEP